MRKRSVSNRCLLCESAASATDVFCAKAQRQQQMSFVRKRSVSNTDAGQLAVITWMR
ncbi:hypothetical protein [Lysinibacillus xylanilyticus]|uniref:hypothetical protein n=1 Tax=Lysinibacillus xylanilyticus TaxID=582475 RepID=UPI002B245844|nr:hypothetical protein [Lysinibacillus xylanilyticus]